MWVYRACKLSALLLTTANVSTSLFAAVRSKEQVQHVLKLVEAFPQTWMSSGSYLQGWVPVEPVTKSYISHSRTHGLSSVPDTLKATQRDPSSTESTHSMSSEPLTAFSFPFIIMGSCFPQTPSDRCRSQCILAGHQFRLFGTKRNERFCEGEACQAPCFSREGIWTDTTSC